MATATGRAPLWINVRNSGVFKCDGCQAELQRGDSSLYDFNTQRYLKCHRCDTSGPAAQPEPVIDPPPPVPAPATPSPAPAAAGTLAALVAQVESFARVNARAGADVRRVADAALVAVMRAIASE
jgi:hypothetical protein